MDIKGIISNACELNVKNVKDNMTEEELLKRWGVHSVVQEAIKTAHTKPSSETQKMFEEMREQNEKLLNELQTYVKSDNEWKEKYAPFLEGLLNLSKAGKIWVMICLGISATAGAVIAVKSFFK